MNNFIENDGIIQNGNWAIERRWRQGGYLETTIYYNNKEIVDTFLTSTSLRELKELIEFVLKDFDGEIDPCSTERINSHIIDDYLREKINNDCKK